ncbi:MAG: glycosyltransferase family 39 protein [Nitrospirae bacterium]|nr:glycosyltransferase family 39 protein [Nitrospirota bacterium]
MTIIFYTLFYTFSCFCFGVLILRIFRLQAWRTSSAQLSTSFLLGQGVLSSIWIFLGLSSLFKVSFIMTILVAAVAGGIFFISDVQNHIKNLLQHIKESPIAWKLLWLLTAVLIVLFGIKSIAAPPTGDAEAFYMVLPKIMASAERLMPQPNYYEFSQIGLFGEMHYAALMALSSQQAAKLFSWITALALAAILIALCDEAGIRHRGKIAALIMLFSSSTFTNYIFDGKVDVFGGALGLAAYLWALKAGEEQRPGAYALAGLFTGFAAISKFSNIPVVIPGVLLLMIWPHGSISKTWDQHPYRKLMAALMLFGFCAFLSMLPHFIKNYLLYGEPFAPFLFLKGVGNHWTDQVWFSPETAKYILKTYPFALVFGQYPMQGGNISALVLAFLPIGMFLGRNLPLPEYRRIFRITIAAFTGVVTWIIVRPAVISPRYILATLLLFIPMAATGIERLFLYTSRYRLLKGVTYGGLLFVLVCSIFQSNFLIRKFSDSLSGNIDHWKESGYCGMLSLVNEKTVPGDRVFLAGYYAQCLRPDLLQCMNGNEDASLYDMTLKDNYWERMYQRGFIYVLVQKASHAWILPYLSDATIPDGLDIIRIYDEPGYILYKMTLRNNSRLPMYTCRQGNTPAWEVVKFKN